MRTITLPWESWRAVIAALLGRSVDTEAGKRRCPRCPNRTCCVYTGSSPTPGCRFGAAPTAMQDGAAIRTKVCGGHMFMSSSVNTPASSGNTTVCSTAGDACIIVGCPLY